MQSIVLQARKDGLLDVVDSVIGSEGQFYQIGNASLLYEIDNAIGSKGWCYQIERIILFCEADSAIGSEGECSLFGMLVQLKREGGASKWRQSRLLIKKGKD